MNIKKTAVTLLVLGAVVFVGFALAQQERTAPANRPQQVDAAELERLAAQPSMEQDILKLAAEKLRQEGKPTTTVELPLNVKVRKISAPPCWYEICVNYGTKKVACKYQLCLTINPD